MNEIDERPKWLDRVQNNGLTPAGLETYLAAGWPLTAIASDRNLDVGDIQNAAERWDIQIGSAV